MGQKSVYLEKLVLDGIFGGATITVPSTLYFALFTTSPTAGNDSGTEVSGGSYARQSMTNNATNFPSASQSGSNPSKKNNGVAILFTTATADWGTVVAFGVYDASSGGNLLYWGSVTPSVDVPNGLAFNVSVGNLKISES